MASAVVPALGILSGSPSNFESNDGNMTVGAMNNADWANVDFLHLPDLSASTSDDSFTPGQKQDSACPDVSGHKNPPKDDFTDVARYAEVSNTGHTYLYGATIRYAANGNASENVELKQGTDGLCPGSTTMLKRVAGDALIAIDYVGGGTTANFSVLRWVTSGACFVGNHSAPCWGADVQTLEANQAEGAVNPAPISLEDNPISNKALVTGQFAEFGIDLSAGTDPIVPIGSCSPFAQTIWESRAAGSSFVSTTKDIVVDDVGFSNCGQIKIIKNTDPRGLDQDFGFTSNLPENASAGGNCSGVADGDFCLNDKSSTTNNVEVSNVPQGTYTVTEGADPAGFEFDSVTCVEADGTTAEGVTIVGKLATIELKPNDNITCTYVNNQLTGAIEVTKISSKTSATPLAGAHFAICTNNEPYTADDPCVPAQTGSNDLVTGSDGTVCIDDLALGDYYVTETTAPPGHAIDDTTTSLIKVDNGAVCSDDPYDGEATTYTDTPLTDVTVNVTSQDAVNGTKSAVTCTADVNGDDIGNSPQPNGVTLGDFSTYDDPVTLSADDLSPGTYTCTIDIDP